MNIDKLMTRIETLRKVNKTHKAALCSVAGITTTYYNQLLTGGKSPSFGIVDALCAGVGLRIIIADAECLEM